MWFCSDCMWKYELIGGAEEEALFWAEGFKNEPPQPMDRDAGRVRPRG